jgi:hypothetical protein
VCVGRGVPGGWFRHTRTGIPLSGTPVYGHGGPEWGETSASPAGSGEPERMGGGEATEEATGSECDQSGTGSAGSQNSIPAIDSIAGRLNVSTLPSACVILLSLSCDCRLLS